MSSVLDWRYDLREIGQGGLTASRAATDGERAALAEALDLLACESLEAVYDIRSLSAGRFTIAGTLTARIVQACVVTLEPVTSRMVERFAVELWPEGDVPTPISSSGTFDALAPDQPEPLEDGRIPIGRIVYEHLAAGLDPYPRRPGAEFGTSAHVAPASPDNPFAALAKLKPKS